MWLFLCKYTILKDTAGQSARTWPAYHSAKVCSSFQVDYLLLGDGNEKKKCLNESAYNIILSTWVVGTHLAFEFKHIEKIAKWTQPKFWTLYVNIFKYTNTSMTSYCPKLFISCNKTKNTQTLKNNIRPKFQNIYLVISISNICLHICFLSPSSSGGAEEVHASLIIFVITIRNHQFIF